MHLRQPGFTYSAYGPFTKNKERLQTFKETGDTKYFYRNELDKAYFQHDMAYGDFKDLARITASDKILRDKALKIKETKHKNSKYDGYQRVVASMVYKFLIKKTLVSGVKSMPNEQLADELHKLIIRIFKKKESIFII